MPPGDTLWKRLESARTAELHKLANIVGLRDAERQTDAELVEELSKAIRSAAYSSQTNRLLLSAMIRFMTDNYSSKLSRDDHEFPYKQMLIDVAHGLDPNWTPQNDQHDEIEIEETIWRLYENRMREEIAKLPEQDKAELRKKAEEEFGDDTAISLWIASGEWKVAAVGGLVGSGLMSLVLGGIEVLPLAWLAFPLSFLSLQPRYARIVQVTIQLIYIRKLRELESGLG